MKLSEQLRAWTDCEPGEMIYIPPARVLAMVQHAEALERELECLRRPRAGQVTVLSHLIDSSVTS